MRNIRGHFNSDIQKNCYFYQFDIILEPSKIWWICRQVMQLNSVDNLIVLILCTTPIS